MRGLEGNACINKHNSMDIFVHPAHHELMAGINVIKQILTWLSAALHLECVPNNFL